MEFIAYVVLFVVMLAYWVVTSRTHLRNIPMPTLPSILWGHDRVIYEESAGEAYKKWFNEVGFVYKIRGAFFHPDLLVLGDPKALAHVLQTNIYDYHHSKVVRPRIARLLGRSLGWVEGESEHKRMRGLVSPSLSLSSIKDMTTTIYDAANSVKARLVETIASAGGSSIENMQQWTGQATLEVTGRVSFNHDFDAGRSHDAQQILGSWSKMVAFGMQFKGFVALMLLRKFPIINYLPIKANRAHSTVKLTIHDGVGAEVIRRNADSAAKDKRKDLLSILLTAHQNGEISRQEMLDHISMFIMAGSETTAQTLVFALWELSKNETAQNKLRDEVTSFGREPTYDDFTSKLPFLDAVLHEALRCHPALPYMERVATKDDVLPLRRPVIDRLGHSIESLAVKEGQIIVIPITAINRQARVWGSDADIFRPERWLETLPDADLLPHGWGQTLSFSEGARNCVGQRLAVFQFKIILFTLIKDLRFFDTGLKINSKALPSLQPWIEGRLVEGPQLPIGVALV